MNNKVTFWDVSRFLTYIKVIWNGEVVFDDENCDKLLNLIDFEKEYNNKEVYEANIKVVQFHHCILDIKGE